MNYSSDANPKENSSSWSDLFAGFKKYPALNKPMHAEVAIVGGGLTGILSAYLLSCAGITPVILEKGRIGSGATSLTTAFLTQNIDTSIADLKIMYGEEGVSQILDSHFQAIELYESIVEKERISCEFGRCSDYIFSVNESEDRDVEKEFTTMRSHKLPVQLKKASDLGFPTTSYIELKNQAKFNPLLLLSGLLKALERQGVQIYENTEVKDIYESDENKPILKTDFADVSAQYVIIATHTPFNKPLSLYFKRAIYDSYVLELETRKSALLEGIYEDMKNPYHYFRVDRGENKDRIIIGGEDHRADLHFSEEKSFASLLRFAEETFLGADFRVLRRWHGPIIEPVDGICYIGPLKDGGRVLHATGYSGNGTTYAAISAMILRDYILGIKNPWSSVYRAKRLPSLVSLSLKGRDYTEELLHRLKRS
jgi:glycine/D-amino acid oxidase-like deaminating enzyme